MEHKIWNERFECMDRQELAEFQLARLKETVDLCYNKVPLYRKNSTRSVFVPSTSRHSRTSS